MQNIKEHVKIVEGLVWPAADVNSFHGQKAQMNVHVELMQYVNNKSVLVQAGGNCGMVLSTLINYFDAVYTFEPDPVNFYCLNQNIVDSKVIKIQGCLGNNAAPVNVQIRSGHPDIGSFYVNGSGNIPVFRVDDLRLHDCGLIFLDVEGYEQEALMGSINTIQKYKPAIYFESFEPWLECQNTSSTRLKALLMSLNYKKIQLSTTADEFWVYNVV